jgi:hypothetical protein
MLAPRAQRDPRLEPQETVDLLSEHPTLPIPSYVGDLAERFPETPGGDLTDETPTVAVSPDTAWWVARVAFGADTRQASKPARG